MGIDIKIPEIFFLKHSFGEMRGDRIEYRVLGATSIPQEIEIVYLFGYSPFIGPLLEWAQEDQKRLLVILENRGEVLLQLEKEGLLEPFLAENIQFRFWPLEMAIEEFAMNLVFEFPFGKLHYLSLQEDEALSEKLKREILRKTTLTDAIHTEMIQYHKLFSNLISNFQRLPEAFDLSCWKDQFAGIPSLICGAGPSLKDGEALFAAEEKILIFAGGSAIPALNKIGVMPHLLFAVDPNPEEFTRLALHTCPDIPLVFAPRLEKRVVEMHTGPLGFFPTGTGGAIEDYILEKLGIRDAKILENLGEEALSVTCIALMTALYMGCNPIIFAGVDLSFTGGKRYAEGVPADEEILEPRLEEEGKETLTRWIMERDTIAAVVRVYPDRSFYRVSNEGLSVEGVSVLQEAPFLKKRPRDLRGELYKKVFGSQLTISQREVEAILQELKESFEMAQGLIQRIQEEPLRAPVLIMDLEETLSYRLALKGSSFALAHFIEKKEGLQGKELERELYKNLELVVEGFLRCF